MFRIGHGFDIHRYESSDNAGVYLAGVCVPYSQGVAAHSDGDVVFHAAIDALLGALALGDIGKWFPDTDPAYKNMQSIHMLAKVMNKVQAKQYQICNIDLTIVAQKPKLADYIDDMRTNLAESLCVSLEQVSIKAKTHEKVDAIGDEKAIAAHAVVLLHAS